MLNDQFGMRNLSTREVSCLLTIDRKHNFVTTSKKLLALFNRNSDDLLHRFISITQEEQLKQWVSPNELTSKKGEIGLSVNKVTATGFFESKDQSTAVIIPKWPYLVVVVVMLKFNEIVTKCWIHISRFCPQLLLSVFKVEKMARWKEMLLQRWNHRSNDRLF